MGLPGPPREAAKWTAQRSGCAKALAKDCWRKARTSSTKAWLISTWPANDRSRSFATSIAWVLGQRSTAPFGRSVMAPAPEAVAALSEGRLALANSSQARCNPTTVDLDSSKGARSSLILAWASTSRSCTSRIALNFSLTSPWCLSLSNSSCPATAGRAVNTGNGSQCLTGADRCRRAFSGKMKVTLSGSSTVRRAWVMMWHSAKYARGRGVRQANAFCRTSSRNNTCSRAALECSRAARSSSSPFAAKASCSRQRRPASKQATARRAWQSKFQAKPAAACRATSGSMGSATEASSGAISPSFSTGPFGGIAPGAFTAPEVPLSGRASRPPGEGGGSTRTCARTRRGAHADASACG
mmetsp:Transcript_116612/g.370914  ORF Transcript_116612/g.370914 Transcript_116612/m.370914 type:complete len:356 (-) Transcript_116612:34-1101(-)